MNSTSIYKQFYQKLIIATSIFVLSLSFIFYAYTKATIYEDIKQNLINDAKLIKKISLENSLENNKLNVITNSGIDIDIVNLQSYKNDIITKEYKKDNDFYIELYYPYKIEEENFIKIRKNINSSREMLNKIFNNIIFLNMVGFILVILYAITVSKTLLKPIIVITNRLSNMNENFLTQIEKKDLPIEFHSLANSINNLTNKIQTFVKFKKELFIGAAHELKTPLAVMKLKNEVTLMKKRDTQKYEETLKITIKEINDMNKMVSSILDIGRAEGAQFEKPILVDLIEFLQTKANDYQLLAKQKNINLEYNPEISTFKTMLQPTLLTHIIQNFVQNAIKFTPNEKNIVISAYKNENKLIVEIIDEGPGINEEIDLFAPFKRIGNEAGAGLGLFLAQNAADTLGAKISLKNRTDGITGSVAKLCLPQNIKN